MLPGEGWAPRRSTPISLATASRRATAWRIFSPTSGVEARAANRRSAPMNSVTSERITVPPSRTKMSAAAPTAGFAVTPDQASEPPHSTPTMSLEIGTGSRRTVATSWSNSRAIPTPLSTAARLPPTSWTITSSRRTPLSLSLSAISFVGMASQPKPTRSVAPTLGCAA